MGTLPSCDDLFLRYFDRWYSDTQRGRRIFKATKPDMYQLGAVVGSTISEISPINNTGQQKALTQIATMVNAAREDWGGYLNIYGEIEVHWIDAFDKYYDRAKIGEIIDRSDPAEFSCEYIVLCCELGAVIGEVMRAMCPRLIWYLDWPYWESMLFDPKSKTVIPAFHWAIGKMSEYGVEDGLVAKMGRAVEILNEDTAKI